MPALENVTVEAVSIKPLPSPDKYHNTHRRSIKVGEDWYSCGSGKSDKFNVKTSDGWEELTKGSKVEFMYKVNGDFKNVDMKTLTLLAKGEASAPKQQTQSNVPKNKDFVNPATVGACLNLAVEVLKYKEKDFEDEAKLIKAIRWHKSTFERMEKLYPTVSIEEVKSAPPQHEEDDEI